MLGAKLIDKEGMRDKVDEAAEELFQQDPVEALDIIQKIKKRFEEWFCR